jgi:glycosyltransferase involved in cell wall biosynthesis
MSKRSRSTKSPNKPISDAAITHSIIVPAYKEKLNLRPLTTRLFTALADSDSLVSADNVELIVVDDNSKDGSVEEVETLRDEGYNIRIIVRTNERGLSSAVVRGFKEAKGDAMICMDADLQVCYCFSSKTDLAPSGGGTKNVGCDYGEETFCVRYQIWTRS